MAGAAGLDARSAKGLTLAGKVVLVTGAAGGIGAAIVESLLQAGATVHGVDVAEGPLANLRDRFPATAPLDTGGVDVSDAPQCAAAVVACLTQHGRLDALVNVAGILTGGGPIGPFWQIDPVAWRRVQQVNSAGAFNMAYFAVQPMLRQGRGRLINVSTSHATMTAAGLGAYGPSKAAMEASAGVWAKDLAGTGVTANVVLPGGPTETPFLADAPRPTDLLAPEIMGPPVVWLASDRSDGVTGRRLIARTWALGAGAGSAPIDFGAGG